MPRQEIACPPKPGKQCGQCHQVEGRDVSATGGATDTGMPSRAMPMKRMQPMSVQSGQVNVDVRESHSSGDEHQNAQEESHDKTDQIKISPGHDRPPFLLCPLVPAGGFNASSNLSASPGVSKIAPSNSKHLRVSFSRAAFKRTALNSGSPANRSDPCNSHTSSLPSTVRKSEVNSV